MPRGQICKLLIQHGEVGRRGWRLEPATTCLKGMRHPSLDSKLYVLFFGVSKMLVVRRVMDLVCLPRSAFWFRWFKRSQVNDPRASHKTRHQGHVVRPSSCVFYPRGNFPAFAQLIANRDCARPRFLPHRSSLKGSSFHVSFRT
jgi:hypothetical protein